MGRPLDGITRLPKAQMWQVKNLALWKAYAKPLQDAGRVEITNLDVLGPRVDGSK
jgi:hypothetical protein